MTEWETDDEYTTKGHGVSKLSTARKEPFSRTPSAKSRRSTRRSMTPPARGPSPSTMPTERVDKRSSRDVTTDETISILDPRRFTPTLHANLVSEILALRRDQDEKIRQIESLESALHSVKQEHEQLQESATTTSKESRSLKRQLSLLEGGTESALGELARERDEAVDSIAETKKRLDLAQKKIRNQEDDSQRVHELWAHEKDEWEDERRKYERKLHIAESRLKIVLDEVAAYQANHMDGAQGAAHDQDSDVEESGRENDAGSVRTMSMTNSIRHSLISGPILHPGNSLADELTFDDDDQTDADGRESVLSIRTSPKHKRTFSRDSVVSRLHRRNHSMESLKRPGSVARSRLFMNPSVLEALEGEDEEPEAQPRDTGASKMSYTDTGVQYSPPPSPVVSRFKTSTPDIGVQRVKTPEWDSPARGDSEVEANQRKKRVHIGRPLVIDPPKPDNRMVSAAAQTMEMPLSPPKTPQTPVIELQTPEPARVLMVASSTQTDEGTIGSHDMSPTTQKQPSPPPLEIPTINIYPPTSRPATPQEPRLPQNFKHFGCQVNLSAKLVTSDASVQTEGIQVDKRLALLPAHLQPSAISSRPTSPNVSKASQENDFTPVPARNPRRLTNGYDAEFMSSPVTSPGDDDDLQDSYQSLIDDHPLASQKDSKRGNRFSSIFAGFDTASSDEGDAFADLDVSDSEYRTALSAPRPPTTSTKAAKRGSFGTVPTSPEQHRPKALSKSSIKPVGAEMYNPFHLADKENDIRDHGRKFSRTYEKPPAAPPSSSSNHNSGIRKAALIQSGIATQQSRSRSPSIPDGKNPPFPIPNRESSRRSQYTPSDGRESPTRGEMWHRRGSSRSSYQSYSIRKVRSAAALPRVYRYRRRGSRSPPPLSPSTEAPESPGLPPLPQNDITTPRTGRERGPPSYRRHRHELSTNTDNTNNTTNTNNTNNTVPTIDTGVSHTTGVVDAIAQTMVGEWMLKYVRRRKSFSVPESNGKDDNSNDRHKRWVWLAPYERSILWSSKQPSTGSALLGKTGRKLTIQSVLDVKDDNPAPKVMPSVFNRSILILTPQRALKFTASSPERHYLWLTALSFLAHSSQAVPEIISAPYPKAKEQQQHQPLPEFEAPQPKIKRGGIRDSIRLAKGKTAGVKMGIPSVPSSLITDTATFRVPESSSTTPGGGHSREESRDAAEPPFIPRFSDRSGHPVQTHGRKRSNTGGHVAPPLSFRGFSGPVGTGNAPHQSGQSTTNGSLDTTMSSEVYHSQASTNTTWNMSQPASQRTSEASSGPGNFFDAIGTVRMEAFISPLAYSQYGEYPDDGSEDFRRSARRRSKDIRRRNSRSRHRDGYGYRAGRSGDSYSRGRHQQPEEDYFLRDDPFKGF